MKIIKKILEQRKAYTPNQISKLSGYSVEEVNKYLDSRVEYDEVLARGAVTAGTDILTTIAGLHLDYVRSVTSLIGVSTKGMDLQEAEDLRAKENINRTRMINGLSTIIKDTATIMEVLGKVKVNKTDVNVTHTLAPQLSPAQQKRLMEREIAKIGKTKIIKD